MNLYARNRFDMSKRVQDVLEQYQPVWQDNTFFTQQKTRLDELIAAIEAREVSKGTIPLGTVNEKARIREQIENSVTRIQGGLRVYAVVQQNAELLNRVSAVFNVVKSLPEAEMLNHSRIQVSLATEFQQELAELGITQAHIQEVADNITAFDHILEKAKVGQHELNTVKKRVRELTDACVEVVKQHLLPLMPIFRDTHPDFYDKFLYAQKIYHRRGSQLPTDPVPDTTDTP